jgi:glycosyltransferase involved in cell wall biosynthesis
MPTVSVIVPNYNHARFLRKRVDTILAQTYQDFELILLDDASTDNSRFILNEYSSDPRVTHVQFNEANSGSTFKQWNRGVRLARGRYVWMAESDDYADPRLLERLVEPLDTDTGLALCYSRSWRVAADGTIDGFWDSYLGHLDPERWAGDFCADGLEECRRYLVHCNTVQSASSVVFRRDMYWKTGGADENLVLGGDWKMWAGMALSGGAIAHVGDPLNYCRFHDGSVSQRSSRDGVWARESLAVVRWMLKKMEVDNETRSGLCDELSRLWLPAVMNGPIPLSCRCAILRDARGIDPRAFGRLVRFGLASYVSRLRSSSSSRA